MVEEKKLLFQLHINSFLFFILIKKNNNKRKSLIIFLFIFFDCYFVLISYKSLKENGFYVHT